MKAASLIDIDNTGLPNLALMRLSTWLKGRGYSVHLNEFKEGPVYASTVFSWNRTKAEALAQRGAEVGGSGLKLETSLMPEVEAVPADYSLYDLDYGWGFLSRGCPRRCEFCVVPKKEGKWHEVATIDELLHPQSNFLILLDNNFLGHRTWALERLREMRQRHIEVSFSQGLDIRYVTRDVAKELANVDFWNLRHTARQLTFAFDSVNSEAAVRRGVRYLVDAGIRPAQLQFFVLVGFDSDLEEDLYRINVLRSLKADAFVMAYRDPANGQVAQQTHVRHIARWANRRYYTVCDFADYAPWKKRSAQSVLPFDVA